MTAREHLKFWKYEGLGNDFVVVERDTLPDALRSPEALGRLCHRHRRVGADGVLVLSENPLRMSIVNADGSPAEMCGNGLRCALLHWYLEDKLATRRLEAPAMVETDAGPHQGRVLHTQGVEAHIEVEMAPAETDPDALPVDSEMWPRAEPASAPLKLRDEPFKLDDKTLGLTVVSFGNPHAVTFDAAAQEARDTLGPTIERHPAFVEGANVSFAKMREDGEIDLRVWERGAGWTLACGTGACATAMAAVLTGRAEPETWLKLHLPGGRLDIRVDADKARVTMRGPAKRVFTGYLDL